MRKIILGILLLFLLVSTSFATEALYYNTRGLEVADTDTPGTILYDAINVDTGTGAVTFHGQYEFPVADGTATYVLATDGAGNIDFAAPTTATFTGGAISSDITLANGVDIKSSTTTAEAATIQVYDLTAAPSYTNVLSWTNGAIPDIVLGAATNTLAITSTGLNVTSAGAVTGVTDLTVAGAVTGVTDLTASGTLTAGDWSIGTFTTTGVTTLGNNTAAFSVASTGIDISSAGAVSNVTTLGLSGDITSSAGDILLATGKGIKSSTTTAHTVGIYGYDTDGAYRAALVVTNSATPATVLGSTDGTTAISSSDWTISTAGVMAGIGAIGTDGVITSTNATDASSLSTASVVLAGGLAVTKQLYIGDDIDMSVSTTGVYDLTLNTNQADALSIRDSAADIIVFGTTTGSPLVTITPATTITGLLTANGSVAVGDADYIGVTSNEIITFNTAGTIKVSGADFYVGGTAADEVRPSFFIVGDADSDGTATSETLTVALTANTDPTAATWDITSTQSAGYSFDKLVSFNGGATLGNAVTDINTFTGKIAGATPMSFDGATPDAVYTILAVDDPASSSKTVTLPAVTGTVMLTGAATVITAGATPDITVTKGNQLFTDTITTDNQDQTLTFSGGGAAGDRVTIIFVTDTGGSGDEVITFQTTLANTTGTLTLDNLTAGRYVIEFVSDGTVWNEVSRTAAQS